MYFYSDNQKIKIPNSLFLHKIGSGKEANVYKLNDKVIKILKNKKLKCIQNKEECHLKLTNINTKQIILPTKLYYDKNNLYMANESLYVKPSKKTILQYSLEEMIYNMENLEKDIIEISRNFIRIKDLYISNCVLGDYIYIVDFGYFKIDIDELKNNNWLKLKEMNEYSLKVFFINTLIETLKNQNTDEVYKYYLRSIKEKIALSELLKEKNDINKIYSKVK